MDTAQILEKIGEKLGSTATVKSVFGEPIHAEGKTVVPVAKVAFGFGAGGGKREEGSGGGGGVHAYPAGALEITADGTRFVPFHDVRLLAGAFAAGVMFASLFFSRRR